MAKLSPFRPLSLDDQEPMQRLAGRYAPYSDVDFAISWTWCPIAEIAWGNGAEVFALRLTDCVTDQPFYTFLAPPEHIEAVADDVLNHIVANDPSAYLACVPAEIAQVLRSEQFQCAPMRASADYLFDVREHLTFRGGRYSHKRHEWNKFRAHCPDAQVVSLDLAAYDARRAVERIWDRWAAHRGGDVPNETRAFERFLAVQDRFDVCCTGMVIRGDLAAVNIVVMLAEPYGINLFEKADRGYPGIYTGIGRAMAEALVSRNRYLVNGQEDLGSPGLRQAKMLLRPVRLLEKFSVTRVTAGAGVGEAMALAATGSLT